MTFRRSLYWRDPDIVIGSAIGASASIQNTTMKTVGRIGAVLAFAFCLLGGLWILSRANFTSKDDILATAIGFYFVGKAFFVGPMLWLAAGKCCTPQDGK
jgi:hypothetical protein